MSRTAVDGLLVAARPYARIMLGAVVLLALLAVTFTVARRADAGAIGIVTVNSTANTDDGQCNGPPNDQAVGNCTLREAINAVNLGFADEIHFHPAVFPQSTHGVIQLELGFGLLPPIMREVKIDAKGVGVVLDGDWDDDGIGMPYGILVLATHNGFDFEINGGGSTFIIQDIGCGQTENGSDTGESVSGGSIIICRVIDGGTGVAGNAQLVPFGGIVVSGFCGDDNLSTHVSGALIPCCTAVNSVQGECDPCLQSVSGFTCGTGEESVSGPPVIVGGPFSLGDVRIDGIEIHNAQGVDGILMDATNLNNINITNSKIEAGGDAIELIAFSPPSPDGRLTNNNVHINGNRLIGGEGEFFLGGGDQSVSGIKTVANGVRVDFCCDVHSKITADVSNNESIVGNFGVGVFLGYCGGGCAQADGSAWNFTVNDNGKISGQAAAVFVDIDADGNPPSSFPHDGSNLNADVQVNGNAIMDGATSDGVRVDVDICCATSGNTSTVSVSGNSDIVGDSVGVNIVNTVGEGVHNTAETHVDDNGEITGEGSEGVLIGSFAGSSVDDDVDADSNTNITTVNGNQDINGDDSTGVYINAGSGKRDGPGDADRNTTHVEVNSNQNITGDDGDGVGMFASAGTDDGPGDADDNVVEVQANSNGTIDGAAGEGVDLVVVAGHTEAGPTDNVTGDGNSTSIEVDGNQDIHGHESDGVFAQSRAGGLGTTGEENHTAVDVTDNTNITGGRGGGDGVEVDSLVCCDPDNENGGQTNFINISGNQNIIGVDDDGVDINQLCCSINTVMIQDNTGVIKGNADNGIEISPCLQSGNPNDPTDISSGTTPLDDVPCMGDTVTALTITGNNISDSGEDGILICCGAFQFPVNQAPAGVAGPGLKSVIDDNVISHNGEDGVDLDTTIGINLSHNEIFLNGTSASDGDNGVEIDWQFGWTIASATCGIAGGQVQGISPFCVKVPAHFNRISENSIYDNRGLGINLIGIQIEPSVIEHPGAGTEGPGWGHVDGVGCNQFSFTPIAANDCIPYPKILFTGGVTVANLSGIACASCLVEVFIADDTPGDQTGPLARQHGEGRTYVTNVQADAAGNFDVELPCGMAAGILTATATDKLKNTSEFASNIPFPGTPACAAATEQPTDTPAPAEPTATPVPPTATAVPTEEPQGLCGDVNSDGVVNALDAALILQLAAGYIDTLPKGNDAGDVNNDGTTNSIDAALILQSAAAMINASGFSCP